MKSVTCSPEVRKPTQREFRRAVFSVIAIAESDATLMQRERGCSESVKEELGEPHNTCEPFSIRGERETPV